MRLGSHVMCPSYQMKKKSTLEYSPMAMKLLLLFCSTFLVGIGHYFVNPSSWHQVELFGGLGNKKSLLPGEVSFLTWIFHWSMMFDFLVLLRYMWRWGDDDCTNNCKWRLYAQLHVPACIINGIVVMNHLHRDRLVALRALHPVLVFISSVATLLGSYAIVKENGWSMLGNQQDVNVNRKRGWSSILVPAERDGHVKNRDWDVKYTMVSMIVGAVFAFVSTRLTV